VEDDQPIVKMESARAEAADTSSPAPPPHKKPAEIDRMEIAEKTVEKYTVLSATTALVPFPVVDFIAVTSIALKMLKALCDHYEVPFSKEKGKMIIGSLAGGVFSGLMAGSLVKIVPFFGIAAAVAPAAAASGAITWALGSIFIRHFESGGTLLDLEPGAYRKYFKTAYKERGQLNLKQGS